MQARYTHPPLSTLVLSNYEMGQRAAEALIDMTMNGKRLAPMTIKIDGPLVPRGSTARPRNLAATEERNEHRQSTESLAYERG